MSCNDYTHRRSLPTPHALFKLFFDIRVDHFVFEYAIKISAAKVILSGSLVRILSVPCNGRRAVTVQRISQEYGKPALWIVTVPVSVQPCYGVYVSWNSFLVRIISFFRINIPLFEPYHGGTVECQTPPCWLWTCRNSRLKLLFVKSGSSGGVGTMYWQKTVKLSGSCSTVGKTLPSGIHYMHRLKFCYRSASIVISYRGL